LFFSIRKFVLQFFLPNVTFHSELSLLSKLTWILWVTYITEIHIYFEYSNLRLSLCKFHRCVQVTFKMLLKQSTKNALKCIYLEEKCRNAKLVNIHRIALQIHLNKHSLIKNEACFKYSTSFLSLSLSLKVLVVYSTMESSNRHNPTREASDYEDMHFITCFCMCAHLCPYCVSLYTSFSLCLYLSVYACMSVCGERWQHTRCPLGRGSTGNISKQWTCWRALTLSTPLNSIPPSPCTHVCSTSVSPQQGNSNIHLPSFVKGTMNPLCTAEETCVCVFGVCFVCV